VIGFEGEGGLTDREGKSAPLAKTTRGEVALAPLHKRPLGTRVLQGVAIAVWVTVLGFVVRHGSPSNLSVRDAALLLLVVGVAGAVGGGIYYATDRLRFSGRRAMADVLCLVAYAVAAFGLLALVAHWL
jgi:hypothetical protein